MAGMRRVLVAACLVGLALRLLGLQYGLPHVYNPDEVAIMTRALSFAKGTLNPQNFLYPTFFFYVLFAWVGAYLGFVWVSGGVRSLAELQLQFFTNPTGIYTAGRLLTALAGTATIAAAYRLAREIADARVAAAAAIFVAVAPLHVRDSHYVKHDVPATLMIVIAYLAMLRVWPGRGSTRGSRGKTWMAAAACGAAFSTHYYCVFLGIPLLAVVVLASRERGPGAVLRECLLATLVSLGVFLLLSPFLALEPTIAWRDIAANREIVVDRAVEAGAFSPVRRYAGMLLWDAVGLPAVLLAAGGLASMVWTQRSHALLLLAFPVPFFVFITNTVPASRYLNPLVPFLAIFAAYGAAALARLFPAREATFWLLTAAAASPALYESVRTDLFIRRVDTRTIALNLIESTIPRGATVALQPYSTPLQPTRESLVSALERTLGSAANPPPKFRLQLSQDPWPAPAYGLIYLGRGLDFEKTVRRLLGAGWAGRTSSAAAPQRGVCRGQAVQ